MGQCCSKAPSRNQSASHFDLLEISEKGMLAIVPKGGAQGSDQSQVSQSVTNSVDEEMRHICVHGVVPTYRQKAAEEKQIEATSADLLALQQSGIAFSCRKGMKSDPYNQDDFCIVSSRGKLLLGVFDGHGPEGHTISATVRERLPSLLLSEQSALVSHIKAAFEAIHLEVASLACGAQAKFSGTTVATVVISGTSLYSAHLGDSSIVLGKRIHGNLLAESLTRDHKPSVAKERYRIEHCGGSVKRQDGSGPYRVFQGNMGMPGLALSRAVGDLSAQKLGVTHIPEVACVNLAPEHEFVLICSDGVWEFISPDEAVSLVGGFPRNQAKNAANALANHAWNRWIEREKFAVDDITVVLAYFPLFQITS